LTAAFRIVLVLLILVRIGHDCYLSWETCHPPIQRPKKPNVPG
jgi:hypothetical protein